MNRVPISTTANVTTAATQILAAGFRSLVIIGNESDTEIRIGIGVAGVTLTSGVKLAVNGQLVLAPNDAHERESAVNMAIYAIHGGSGNKAVSINIA